MNTSPARDRVFISYSRHDAAAADALADALTTSGVSVWMDRRSIPVTVEWMHEITGGIRGSLLIVFVETERATQSTACQKELEIAESLAKNVIVWNPDDGVASAERQVGDVLQNASETDRAWADVLGRSFRWDRSDRRSDHVSSAKELARARRLGLPFETDALALAYQKASVTRRRRQGVLRIGTAVTTGALIIAGLASTTLDDAVQEEGQEKFQVMSRSMSAVTLAQTRPWEGTAGALETAANPLTPPWLARHMLGQVAAVRMPSRLAGTRHPDATHAAPVTARSIRSAGFKASIQDGAGGVRVTGPGQSRIDIHLRGDLTAWSWSPRAQWLALADQSGIQIVDPSSGLLTELRGLEGLVASISWRGTETLIADTDDGVVAEWPVRPGVRQVADTAAQFVSAAGRNGDVAAVGKAGALVEVASGAISRRGTAAGRGDASSIAAWSKGWAITREGADGTGNVVLVGDGNDQVIELPQCLPMSSASTDGGVAVACLESKIIKVSLPDGALETIELTSQPQGIAVHDRTIVTGSVYGEIEVARGTSRAALLGGWYSNCQASALSMSISSDGTYVANTGANAAFCTRIRRLDGSGAAHAPYVPGAGLTASRAGGWMAGHPWLALTTTGGRVLVVDAEDGGMRESYAVSAHSIDAAAFASATELVAFDASGAVLSIDLGEVARSSGDLEGVLTERLEFGERAGLYQPS